MLEAIKNRRSIRKYKSDAVSSEQIRAVLEAARLAPSGNNKQPWKFMIIRDEEMKKKIVQADNNQAWMLTAPVFIACLADIRARDASFSTDYFADEECSDAELKKAIRDTSIAITCLMLEADNIGLGTCWTGWYEQDEMRMALEIPPYFYVSGILTLGYPDEAPVAKPRHSLEELVLKEV